MSLAVRWSPEAQESLRHLPSWRDAELVSRAVKRFAETGEGLLLVGEHLDDLRLVIGRFVVSFRVEDAATLVVRRVSRRS